MGQACNHVAALLFFIEHHAGDDRLPTEKSKTSKPMTWNQLPKKEVTPSRAEDIIFVKPSHSDLKETSEIKLIKRHQFDPRQPNQRTLQMSGVTKLLCAIRKSVPNSGLQQFWEMNTSVPPIIPSIQQELSTLWNHVIFCHENAAMLQRTFFNPNMQQCFEYMTSMKLMLI